MWFNQYIYLSPTLVHFIISCVGVVALQWFMFKLLEHVGTGLQEYYKKA